MLDKHEFVPGGRHHDYIPEDDCCAHCGNGMDDDGHKNDDGTSYMDTDTNIDRMRFDGSIAPRIR